MANFQRSKIANFQSLPNLKTSADYLHAFRGKVRGKDLKLLAQRGTGTDGISSGKLRHWHRTDTLKEGSRRRVHWRPNQR